MTIKTCDSCGEKVGEFTKTGTMDFPEHLREVCADCNMKLHAQLDDINAQLRDLEAKLKAKLV